MRIRSFGTTNCRTPGRRPRGAIQGLLLPTKQQLSIALIDTPKSPRRITHWHLSDATVPTAFGFLGRNYLVVSIRSRSCALVKACGIMYCALWHGMASPKLGNFIHGVQHKHGSGFPETELWGENWSLSPEAWIANRCSRVRRTCSLLESCNKRISFLFVAGLTKCHSILMLDTLCQFSFPYNLSLGFWMARRGNQTSSVGWSSLLLSFCERFVSGLCTDLRRANLENSGAFDFDLRTECSQLSRCKRTGREK